MTTTAVGSSRYLALDSSRIDISVRQTIDTDAPEQMKRSSSGKKRIRGNDYFVTRPKPHA